MVNLLFCGCLDVQLYCNTWESSHTGRSLRDEKNLDCFYLSLINSVAKSMCLIVETKEEFGLENG